MKNTSQSIGKAGLLGTLIISLTGCVTKTVYVTQTAPPPQPEPQVETPAPTPPPPAPTVYEPTVEIRTETDFYEPLSPYGQWVFIASYGRCWRPSRVDASWRPYSSGHWVRTEAGWYWASEEPWAWATYHYGRWDWTANFGWIWVPQTQWAPAWVSWREGAGYVGWAPLPPTARIHVNGSVEVHETVIAPRFVFVEERHMLEPVHPRTVIVNNTTVINKTVNITKIQVNNNNNTVINEGPKTEVIEKVTGRKVPTTPTHDLRDKEEKPVASRTHKDPPAWGRKGLAPGQTKHDDKPVQTPPDSAKTKPVGHDEKPNELVAQPPVTKPTQPVAEKPSHDEDKDKGKDKDKVAHNEPSRGDDQASRHEDKPETTPVAAKTEPTPAKVDPAPAVQPHEAPHVEKPAKPAKEQPKKQQPAAVPVQAREVHPNNQNANHATTQVTSPKENSNGHQSQGASNSNSQKEQKKKKNESGDNTDKNSNSH